MVVPPRADRGTRPGPGSPPGDPRRNAVLRWLSPARNARRTVAVRPLLLVLPGFLYFTPCRFDILPAALVLASVAAADRRRVALAGLLLGLAVALKMYPLVLAPILLRFTARTWKDAAVWCACAAVPVVASYAVMFATDGVLGATVPLRFQLARDPEPEWCFYGKFLPPMLASKTPLLGALRTAVPLLVAVLLAASRPPDMASLLRRCAVALVTFLTLSVFFSPQWWQWLAVLLVPLAGRSRWLLAAVVALDLWTYLHFPVLFDAIATGTLGEWSSGVRVVHVLVRAVLWFAVAGAFAWREVRGEPGGVHKPGSAQN
ncbi:MAG: glycosyltransferase 87 family protein [Fimbriiglobus sp.]|nr:glycosyltransferase 87 family protein [Fimbriiglobus sp.]